MSSRRRRSAFGRALWANARLALRMASTHLEAGVFAVAVWWIELGTPGQLEFQAAHPWIGKYGVWISIAAWVVVKLWPQRAVTNAALERVGLPPFPPKDDHDPI